MRAPTDFEVYRAIKALNFSKLKPMAQSALQCKWDAEHEQEDKTHFTIGGAVHCKILEPAKFDKLYVVKPDSVSLRTNVGKAWRDERLAAGLGILTSADNETVKLSVEAVMNNADAVRTLKGMRFEQTVEWVDLATGVKCKARLDGLDAARIADLKTGRSLKAFYRDFEKLLYYGQFGFYRDGAVTSGATGDDPECFVIAVETNPPFDSAVFTVPPYVIEAGQRLYRKLLDKWVYCRKSGRWPGRYPVMGNIHISDYAEGSKEEKKSYGEDPF